MLVELTSFLQVTCTQWAPHKEKVLRVSYFPNLGKGIMKFLGRVAH